MYKEKIKKLTTVKKKQFSSSNVFVLNRSLSRLIRKLSLISSTNLLFLFVKMVNSSKEGTLSQFKRWSRIALSFDGFFFQNVRDLTPRSKINLQTYLLSVDCLRSDLQFRLNCIDFACISAIFLSSNDNLLKAHDPIQQKKFNKLLMVNKPKQDPEKMIFNFSKVSLIEAEESILVKGLSFSLPPKQLRYSDYLINFETFYFIDNLKIPSGDNLDFIKTRIKDTALTFFLNYIAMSWNIFLTKNLKR